MGDRSRIASCPRPARRCRRTARRTPQPGEESFLWGALGDSLGAAAAGRRAAAVVPALLVPRHEPEPQPADERRRARVGQGERLAVLRTGGPRARAGRPHAGLLRVLGRLSARRRAWAFAPAGFSRLRRALCRPHDVQPQLSGPCAVRPDLRRRGQPHPRTLPHTGVAGPGPRRVGDRRRRAVGVHGDRTRAGRPGIADLGGGSRASTAPSRTSTRRWDRRVWRLASRRPSRLTTWTQVDGQFREGAATRHTSWSTRPRSRSTAASGSP